jgi:DNA-binding LytR/AlgR family response regulator
MRIVICDDNYSTINFVHNTLECLVKREEWDVEFLLTTRKYQSVQQFIQKRHAEVYYISLDLEDYNGVQLATEIRKQDPTASIILLSETPARLVAIDDRIVNSYQMLLQEQTIRFEKRLTEGFTELYAKKG